MREEEMAVGIVAIVAVFGLPFLGLMIWLVLHYCHETVKAWMEVKLKRDMVARGYTAQEIPGRQFEKGLAAGKDDGRAAG